MRLRQDPHQVCFDIVRQRANVPDEGGLYGFVGNALNRRGRDARDVLRRGESGGTTAKNITRVAPTTIEGISDKAIQASFIGDDGLHKSHSNTCANGVYMHTYV